MQARKLVLLPLLLLSAGVTSCIQSAPKTYEAIDGNWHLTGAVGDFPTSLSQSPLLAFSIGAVGNNIYANGHFGMTCSDGSTGFGNVTISGTTSLTGSIAADGTFVLANSASLLDSIQITIKGKIPENGTTTWPGSYTITGTTAQTACSQSQSGTFVASLYPLLNGTYSGTIVSPQPGSTITVTTQITQNAFTATTSPPSTAPVFFAPLTATITVDNGSSKTSGTTSIQGIPASSSRANGDLFTLQYVLINGNVLTLTGRFGDSSESTLQVLGTPFSGLQGVGVLTKQ